MNAPAPKYKVLVASPWTNANNASSGTTWTVVGRAFPSRDGTGMNVFLHANLAVSGMLVIKLDDGTDDDAGYPDLPDSRKRPSALPGEPNEPF